MFNSSFLKGGIRFFILLFSSALLSFFCIRGEFEVVYLHPEDGGWILNNRIYGFPFPYIYDNVVSSLEHSIILIYFFVDFTFYLLLVSAFFFSFKNEIENFLSSKRGNFFFFGWVIAAFFVTSIRLLFYFFFVTMIDWDLGFRGDSVRWIGFGFSFLYP
ncbi:hypothetical protein EHQ12_09300 [Leptospira gomenensis]|uniref:Uncharacterized protein n=1 Tax=Leptospira gomenensis TaxID=2484974 RepID=A0A5F1YEC8_9LEPT|nr:hypothetical protein [Leptospira gomenensis]TGK37488.1 hypothetical protein EHQ17_02755 [Leptospira gomenensis]TGK39506.1 hypothetical protein EHQ12_09300 [Leptospira gomenensis]TGK43073.1 hypothetical protein EHQ07_13050 [Leptospira gomenensis]TGK54337.1 hypothetical protein EHQ13_19540 [Leptospira gomenensis]